MRKLRLGRCFYKSNLLSSQNSKANSLVIFSDSNQLIQSFFLHSNSNNILLNLFFNSSGASSINFINAFHQTKSFLWIKILYSVSLTSSHLLILNKIFLIIFHVGILEILK